MDVAETDLEKVIKDAIKQNKLIEVNKIIKMLIY